MSQMLVRVDKNIDRNLKAYVDLQNIFTIIDRSEGLWKSEKEKLEEIIADGISDHLRIIGLGVYYQWKEKENK